VVEEMADGQLQQRSAYTARVAEGA